MIAMVPHAQAVLDQIRNPLRRPEVRPVSLSQRSLEEEAHQFLFLGRSQPGRPARRRFGLERFHSARLPRITPTKNTAGMASQATCNLMKRQVLFEEGDHLTTPRFQRFRQTVRSNGDSPQWGCLQYIALFMRMSIVGFRKHIAH